VLGGGVTARRRPTILRRRLGSELRQLRQAAGKTIEQVAGALGYSESKVSRIETGLVSATTADVRAMLELYDTNDQRRQLLVQIAREARQKGWWQSFGDAPAVPLTGLEVEASSIRSYEALLIPGLLQTEEYAARVINALLPEWPEAMIESLIELRIGRQSLLTGEDPPAFWTVIDEAALRRPVGGADAMRAQLTYLAEAAELSCVTLQVLPFGAGEHAGMNGQFTIFGFPDPADHDVVYLEHNANDLYVEEPGEVERYSLLFKKVHAAAREPSESLRFLAKLRRELKKA
jgi:transcriptional regulator with XRE-family HTH domain